MLIALFTALYLLFWSSSSSPLMANLDRTEKLIKVNVADDAHREQALEIVGRMKDVTKAYHSKNENVAKSLAGLVQSRATQPAALKGTLEPLLADDNATREQLVDLRFQLTSVLTAKEWAAVFPPPKAAPAAGAQKAATPDPAHPRHAMSSSVTNLSSSFRGARQDEPGRWVEAVRIP